MARSNAVVQRSDVRRDEIGSLDIVFGEIDRW
jgi:hypothetical protein